jgi:hypothetical protein
LVRIQTGSLESVEVCSTLFYFIMLEKKRYTVCKHRFSSLSSHQNFPMPGGAGGFIQNMITSLRENRNLLRKRNRFHRDEDIELSRVEHKKPLIFKKASDELLIEIKEKHKLKKKLNDLMTIFTVLLAASFAMFLLLKSAHAPQESNTDYFAF